MQRRTPIRKCVGCGSRRDKIELLRIVNNQDEIKIDPGGKLPGRGAYLCPNLQCLEKAHKKNSLSRALKKKISDDIYESISEEIKHD